MRLKSVLHLDGSLAPCLTPSFRDSLGLAVYQYNPIKEKNKEKQMALLRTTTTFQPLTCLKGNMSN